MDHNNPPSLPNPNFLIIRPIEPTLNIVLTIMQSITKLTLPSASSLLILCTSYAIMQPTHTQPYPRYK